MHICFITDEYPMQGVSHGGIGTFVQALARQLVQRNINVSVVGGGSSNSDETENDVGVEIYRIKKSNWPIAKFADFYRRLGKKISEIHAINKIDVVESPELSLQFIPKINGIKYVIRLHGGHHFFIHTLQLKLNKWRAFQEKKAFKKADYFVAVTKYVLDATRKYISIPNEKVTTIYFGVDCEKFHEADPQKMASFKLLFAGTLIEKKGIRQLVKAMPIIKEKFPQVQLDIYGRDWKMSDGKSYLEYLKTEINDSVKDCIFFKGTVPHNQLPEVYESAHLCTFPSHMETQGLVVLEAMAMGKAVLFSTKGPGPETIEHLKDGLLADPYSPEDIAEKICYFFSHPELEHKLGLNARQKMLQYYNLPIVIQNNINFYKKITAQ